MSTNLTNETLLAFVDETGDRGFSKKSSEYFAMAAVVFPASVQQKVKDCIAKIKIELGIPLKTALHWYKHCRLHETRKYITREISKIEGVTVIYVISDKKTMPLDHAKFYNIVAAYVLERILKHAEELNAKISVHYGHIRNFNHLLTLDYFQNKIWRLGSYNNLSDQPKWIAADTNSGIQLADQYAGILNAAMIADKHGDYEPSYLEKIKHQIRKSRNGEISGYGIKAISKDNNPKLFKWWIKGWK